MYTCKCKKLYCGNHIHNHDCNYDHKKDAQDKLILKLPKVIESHNLDKI